MSETFRVSSVSAFYPDLRLFQLHRCTQQLWNRRGTVIILLPAVSNGTFPKKLTPDNMKEVIGATMQERSVEVRC